MSTHAIEIVQIGEVYPHPNADKMELTKIWGWQCCIGKGQFTPGSTAVYVPPDYTVPTARSEFAFLKRDGRDRERITVRRFRGQLSQGLLIPVPVELGDASVGANVMSHLGIERYEPPVRYAEDQFVPGPVNMYSPKFDVENYQRFSDVLKSGEPVIVTEKMHGANARYVYGQSPQATWGMYVGSRTNWMADGKNPWRQALAACPQIAAWCQANPETVLYGEVFGNVQDLKYGANGNVYFAAFAVLAKQRWMDYDEMCHSLAQHAVPVTPLVFRGPFDAEQIAALAEGDSRWPGSNHLAEGVVIVPEAERLDDRIGRVCLKMVSNRYLMS